MKIFCRSYDYKPIGKTKLTEDNFKFQFLDCGDLFEQIEMAAVPQAAFAAKKARINEDKRKEFKCKYIMKSLDICTLLYNSFYEITAN